MGKTGTVKVEVHLVSLKSIVAVVPKDEEEKRQLSKDLNWIGCKGLFVQPWSIRSKDMAREFLQERSNEWEGTIWRDLEWWTVEMWTKV